MGLAARSLSAILCTALTPSRQQILSASHLASQIRSPFHVASQIWSALHFTDPVFFSPLAFSNPVCFSPVSQFRSVSHLALHNRSSSHFYLFNRCCLISHNRHLKPCMFDDSICFLYKFMYDDLGYCSVELTNVHRKRFVVCKL